MKVSVTGSAGKLGKAVMNKLRSTNISVFGSDLVPTDTTYLNLDIKNKNDVNEACRGINAIIHTAAIHGCHYEIKYPREEFYKY